MDAQSSQWINAENGLPIPDSHWLKWIKSKILPT